MDFKSIFEITVSCYMITDVPEVWPRGWVTYIQELGPVSYPTHADESVHFHVWRRKLSPHDATSEFVILLNV